MKNTLILTDFSENAANVAELAAVWTGKSHPELLPYNSYYDNPIMSTMLVVLAWSKSLFSGMTKAWQSSIRAASTGEEFAKATMSNYKTKNMKITILDPAMCCTTGVCGSEVNDNLVQTAAIVKWLKSIGHDVFRHNISNDAAAFKNYPEAINKLQKEGTNSLPYIFINDRMVTSGYYPTKADWEMSFQNNIDINSDSLVGAAKEEKSSDGSCGEGNSCC